MARDAMEAASTYVSTTDLARETISRFVLERAVDSVEREFADQIHLKADLYQSIFAVYRAIDFPAFLPELAAKIVDYRRQIFGADALKTLNAQVNQAWAYYLVNDLERAESTLRQTLPRFDPTDETSEESLIAAHNDLATILADQGRLEEAIEVIEDNVESARARLGEEHSLTLSALSTAGFVHARARNFEQGLVFFEDALEGMRRTLEPDHPRLGRAMLNVASSLGQVGRQAEALELDREIVAFFTATRGRRSANTLRAMNNKANNLAAVERGDEAIQLLVEASELAAEALGSDHPLTLRTRVNLGSHLARQGQRAQAQPILESVADKRLARLGPDHPETLSAQEILANIMLDRGLAAESATILETVLERREGLFGPEHPQTVLARRLLGRSLLETGQYEAAEAHTALATRQLFEQRGGDHRQTLESALDWYRIKQAQGRVEDAERLKTDYLAPLSDRADEDVEHADLARRLAELNS